MRKIKFYKQRDTMGCGVACLQMICSYYGKSIQPMNLLNYVVLQRSVSLCLN